MSEADIERDHAAGTTAAPLARAPIVAATTRAGGDHPLLALQRAIGNQAVQRQLRAGTLSPGILLGQQRVLGNQAVQRALRAGSATPSAPVDATRRLSAPPSAPIGGQRGVIQLTPSFTEWRQANSEPAPSMAPVKQPVIQLTQSFTEWRQANNKPALSNNTIRQEIIDYWASIQADRERAGARVASTLKEAVGGQHTLGEYTQLLDDYAETLTLILQEMDKAPELKQYATDDFIDKHIEGYSHAQTANQITADRNVEISTVLNVSEAANLEKLARELEANSNKTNYFTQGGYPTTWVKNKQDQKVGIANVRITKQKDGGFDKKFNHLDPEIAWVGQEPKPTKWKQL